MRTYRNRTRIIQDSDLYTYKEIQSFLQAQEIRCRYNLIQQCGEYVDKHGEVIPEEIIEGVLASYFENYQKAFKISHAFFYDSQYHPIQAHIEEYPILCTNNTLTIFFGPL